MKKIASAIMLSAVCLSAAAAVKTYEPVISSMDMGRSGAETDASLFVQYTIDRNAWKLPSNTEVILTPMVKFENDSIALPSTVFAGHNAYIAHKRNDDLSDDVRLEKANKGGAFTVTDVIPWHEGMEKPTLTFRSETRGCRCKEEGRYVLPNTLAMDFTPKQFELIVPESQLEAMEAKLENVVKTRSLSRTAYVNYKVNSTVLLPDFRSNPLELKTILATIDSVRADKDLTVDHVEIHGYASPEGPYALNTRLAEGRTQALRDYVDQHYGFGKLLTASSTPEDWTGLKTWVAASSINNKEGILNIIDSDLAPDAKDLKIKRDYPETYRLLLEQVYPSLRRADYKIEYTVQTFTSPATISELLQRDPSKLSLEETMLLARTYDEGSDQRAELLYRAAEIFPADPRAQLNAAFAALGRGDLERAEVLLRKSGDSSVATYARGVLKLYQGDKVEAKALLTAAAQQGVEGASQALKTIEE